MSADSLDILIMGQQEETVAVFLNHLKDTDYKTDVSYFKAQAMETVIMENPKVILMDSSRGNDRLTMHALKKIDVFSQIIIFGESFNDNIKYQLQTGLIFKFIKSDTDRDSFLSVIRSAVSVFHEIENISTKVKKENEYFQKELDWLIWQQSRNESSKYALGRTIIETLTHTVFQGGGIGVAASMADLVEMTMQKNGSSVSVDAEALEMLISNVRNAGYIKKRLDNLISYMDADYDISDLSVSEINELIAESAEKTEKFRKINDHKVIFNKIEYNKKIKSNLEYLGLTFRELIVNAFKYSPPASKIHITKGFSEKGLSILFINSVSTGTRGIQGIPKEYENQIFEPFFRLNRNYDERYAEEELGFGVGLSVIRDGLKKMNGKIFIYEGMDYATESRPRRKIIAEILLT